MKRLLLAPLAAGAVLAITYYAYHVGPVGVVNSILAILLLLRLVYRPSRPVRAVDGAGAVPASLGPSRREWPSQGLVRGGMAMLVTRQFLRRGAPRLMAPYATSAPAIGRDALLS